MKIMKILKDVGVDWRDRGLVIDLYLNQASMVKINNELSEPVKMGRGVRQRCMLSPRLFLYLPSA